MVDHRWERLTMVGNGRPSLGTVNHRRETVDHRWETVDHRWETVDHPLPLNGWPSFTVERLTIRYRWTVNHPLPLNGRPSITVEPLTIHYRWTVDHPLLLNCWPSFSVEQSAIQNCWRSNIGNHTTADHPLLFRGWPSFQLMVDHPLWLIIHYSLPYLAINHPSLCNGSPYVAFK